MIYKIIKDFPNTNDWHVGDLVDITNADTLIKQGLVSVIVPTEVKIEEAEIIEEVKPVIEAKETLKSKAKKLLKKVKGGVK